MGYGAAAAAVVLLVPLPPLLLPPLLLPPLLLPPLLLLLFL